MVERKLAMQGIVEGLDLDNPIGMDPDTYASVQKYTGFYTPLLQSIASVGDLALRGLNTAAYGVAGAAGDIVGDKRLTRDLKAMYQMPFFGAGAAIPKGKLPTSNVTKSPAKITGSRVENIPKKPSNINFAGEEGLYYKTGKPAIQYASDKTNVFPIVKTKPVTIKEFSYDVAKKSVKDIQKSQDRNPKFIQVFDDSGNYVGGVHEGGRQVKLPLTSYERSAAEYNMAKFRNMLDDTYEFSDDIKQKFPGIAVDASKNPNFVKANTDSSAGYALSSTRKPFTDTASINKLETVLLNMQPNQRKLIFKRLLDPTARKEILRTFPEIQGVGIATLTALSSIATAGAIKKKD